MITPGTYKATVFNHAITETKDGSPQATITFSLEADGKSHTITYFGSFKPKAAPHTIKALLVCGLEGNNPAGPLKIGKEVQIVVENEVKDGKTFSKIRWVNNLGAVRNVISQDHAKAKLSALEGAVMAARMNTRHASEDPQDDEMPEWMRG